MSLVHAGEIEIPTDPEGIATEYPWSAAADKMTKALEEIVR